jgi:hypothetical protein
MAVTNEILKQFENGRVRIELWHPLDGREVFEGYLTLKQPRQGVWHVHTARENKSDILATDVKLIEPLS